MKALVAGLVCRWAFQNLKDYVDDWTTNCRDIQDQFDIMHNTSDGIKRKYGMGSGPILTYLYAIGKRMGCEDFD
jgi:hypothetical protein